MGGQCAVLADVNGDLFFDLSEMELPKKLKKLKKARGRLIGLSPIKGRVLL